MTPKEKAEILVRSFGYKIGKEFKNGGFRFNIEIAIQCALIAVDEILKALYEYDKNTEEYLKDDFGDKFMSCELQNMEWDFRYWEEVKQEIQKL